jgi:acetyl esterase/lipase
MAARAEFHKKIETTTKPHRRFLIMHLHRFLITAIATLACSTILAAPAPTPDSSSTSPTVLALWPDGAPGALGTRPEDIPTLTLFPAPASTATGAAMVVCPGGGYRVVGNGIEFAHWLNAVGISAYVLKYRLGSNGYHHPSMLNDANRAMRIVRANSSQWNLDPHRIGIMGSSAGGHLASSVLTYYDNGDPQSTDTIEQQSSRPDLGVLLYPVITMGKFAHAGSRHYLLGDNAPAKLLDEMSTQNHVTSATPTTFLFQTVADKTVPVQNSLMFATALADAHVPFELHIYPDGKHGLGLGLHSPVKDESGYHPYTKELVRWLKERHFANPKSTVPTAAQVAAAGAK